MATLDVPSSPNGPPKECYNEHIVLNVGGTRFETTLKTLTSIRGSRLEGIAKNKTDHPNYRSQFGDYFFDRHPGAFEAVLQLHRCGSLHLDAGVCGNLLKQELKYWGVDDSALEMCCWDGYISSVDRTADFHKLEKHFRGSVHFDKDESTVMPSGKRLARRIWLTLDNPSYSAVSKVLLLLRICFTLAAIALVIAESHCWSITPNSKQDEANVTLNALHSCDYWSTINHVDMTVYIYFVIDFLLRSTMAPHKGRFFSLPFNIIDLVCIAAQTIRIVGRNLPDNLYYGESINTGVKWLGVLQLLRLVQLLRHSDMAKVLTYTMLTSLHELMVVVTFVAFFVVGFGCLGYYVEGSTFYTISRGCWWAFITLTTVGYGDVTPQTPGGYVLACLCALIGIVIMAITIPVVVSNFNLYYGHVRARKQWSKKCKRARLSSSFWRDLPPFQRSFISGASLSHVGLDQSECAAQERK